MATIVVGTDGSKGSEAALSEGFDLAIRLAGALLIEQNDSVSRSMDAVRQDSQPCPRLAA
jgi:nucleotide-binding universal stress UspA family protein